jgi:hypothetical protein
MAAAFGVVRVIAVGNPVCGLLSIAPSQAPFGLAILTPSVALEIDAHQRFGLHLSAKIDELGGANLI